MQRAWLSFSAIDICLLRVPRSANRRDWFSASLIDTDKNQQRKASFDTGVWDIIWESWKQGLEKSKDWEEAAGGSKNGHRLCACSVLRFLFDWTVVLFVDALVVIFGRWDGSVSIAYQDWRNLKRLLGGRKWTVRHSCPLMCVLDGI